jgi:hypothetical protein
MDIADLVVWARLALSPRFMSAFHQPCVGDEVAHRGEALDVVDFVKDYQGQGFSYTRDASKQMNDYRIVFGNLRVDLAFDGENLLVKSIYQRSIHLHTGADHRVGEA